MLPSYQHYFTKQKTFTVCTTYLPTLFHKTKNIYSVHYLLTNIISQNKKHLQGALPIYQHYFTKQKTFTVCTTYLPTLFHKTKNIYSVCYLLTNIISQNIKHLQCALHTYQHYFTKHKTFIVCTTYLPTLFHKTKNIYSVCYLVTSIISQNKNIYSVHYLFTNIISQNKKHLQCALPTYQHYFTKHKTFTVCATYLPTLFHKT